MPRESTVAYGGATGGGGGGDGATMESMAGLAAGVRGPQAVLDEVATRRLGTNPRLIAQSTTPPGATVRSSSTSSGTAATPAASATPAPSASDQRVLVYTATLSLLANNVNETIDRAVALAAAVGGFLATRSDNAVTLRIPVARFHETLAALERLGDVQHRAVQAEDVSEQFHDLEVQLTNLRAVRQRLQEFLNRAANVADALAVERELERVGREIDRIEGQLRFFADRAALSTVTLQVAPRPSSGEMQPTYGTPRLVLPFDWLNGVGLRSLLESR